MSRPASRPASTRTGIVTQDGRQIDLDVIIYATGYHLDFLSTVDIRGRDGKKLTDEWGDSPRAYRGGTVPGFPNLFITSAPNYSPGHGAGANFSMEVLAHYIIECLQLMALRGATTIEVTQRAYEDYVADDRRGDEPARSGATRPTAHTYYRSGSADASWSPPRFGSSTSGMNIAPRSKRTSTAAMTGKLYRQNSFGDRQQPRHRPGDCPAVGRRGRHGRGDRAVARAVTVDRGPATATALPGTIGETVELIEDAGGTAFGVAADLEDAEQRDEPGRRGARPHRAGSTSWSTTPASPTTR